MLDFNHAQLLNFYSKYIAPWSLKIFIALMIFVVGHLVAKLISGAVGKVLSHTKLDKILVEFIQSLVNALLMVFVIVAALDKLGVNTNSVIAVIGAAGLAIGLALQGSLQNFAAGFMLLIFRPFKSGDFVEAAGVAGAIEKIGIFSTTMHTGDNKEVIIPNSAIYSSNIVNYSKRSTRRIDMIFSISYGTDIKKARDLITDIIKAEPRILTEPAPLIAVGELGPTSINLFIRPWVKTDDYWDVKFELNEKIKILFDENEIFIPIAPLDPRLNKVPTV